MRFDAKASNEQKRAKSVRDDLNLAALVVLTPDELDTWLDQNTTNLVQVRSLLKSIVPAVLMIMRGS